MCTQSVTSEVHPTAAHQQLAIHQLYTCYMYCKCMHVLILYIYIFFLMHSMQPIIFTQFMHVIITITAQLVIFKGFKFHGLHAFKKFIKMQLTPLFRPIHEKF